MKDKMQMKEKKSMMSMNEAVMDSIEPERAQEDNETAFKTTNDNTNDGVSSQDVASLVIVVDGRRHSTTRRNTQI